MNFYLFPRRWLHLTERRGASGGCKRNQAGKNTLRTGRAEIIVIATALFAVFTADNDAPVMRPGETANSERRVINLTIGTENSSKPRALIANGQRNESKYSYAGTLIIPETESSILMLMVIGL